jgi:hypothetical protein
MYDFTQVDTQFFCCSLVPSCSPTVHWFVFISDHLAGDAASLKVDDQWNRWLISSTSILMWGA